MAAKWFDSLDTNSIPDPLNPPFSTKNGLFFSWTDVTCVSKTCLFNIFGSEKNVKQIRHWNGGGDVVLVSLRMIISLGSSFELFSCVVFAEGLYLMSSLIAAWTVVWISIGIDSMGWMADGADSR